MGVDKIGIEDARDVDTMEIMKGSVAGFANKICWFGALRNQVLGQRRVVFLD